MYSISINTQIPLLNVRNTAGLESNSSHTNIIFLSVQRENLGLIDCCPISSHAGKQAPKHCLQALQCRLL